MNEFNMKEVKNSLYKSTFSDGMWDIFIGIVFLLVHVIPYLIPNVSIFLVYIISFSFLGIIKSRLVDSRKGRVELDKIFKSNRSKWVVGLLLAAIILTLFILTSIFGITKGAPISMIMSLFIPVVMVIIAYLVKFTRLYYYSMVIEGVYIAILLVALTIGEYSMIESILFLMVCMGIISIGIYILIKFVKQHPLQNDGQE
ncbi:MAG: hypothetical protein JW891_05765 [Candidatus Lokiarchaeota archaeon]|nr:hypothetical protein [Candidatus Lokiarchaeota archaeon]